MVVKTAPAVPFREPRPPRLTRSSSAPERPMASFYLHDPWQDATTTVGKATKTAVDGPMSVGAIVTHHVHLLPSIDDLEERVKTSMGPWALYGLRYSTLVGLGTATLIKVALVLMGGLVPLAPVIGISIFVGVLVGGIVIGALSQSIARRKFIKSGKSEGFLQEIAQRRAAIEAYDKKSVLQTKQLRRLQILEADIRGGVKHSLWSVFHGITGFDPELNRMMKLAKTNPVVVDAKGEDTQAWEQLARQR